MLRDPHIPVNLFLQRRRLEGPLIFWVYQAVIFSRLLHAIAEGSVLNCRSISRLAMGSVIFENKRSTTVKNSASRQNMNWTQQALLPLLFVFLASGCNKSSSTPPQNAGFADINMTVVASDGKKPLPGYQALFVVQFADAQYLLVDTKNSQTSTDQNGLQHLHIEFADTTVLSSATVLLAVLPPGCTNIGCGVGASTFSLQVGQTKTLTIVTNVPAAAQANTDQGQPLTHSLKIITPRSGSPLEGGRTPLVVTSPNDPTQYVPGISARGKVLSPLSAESSMTMRAKDQSPTIVDQGRAHGVDVVVPPASGY